MDREGELGLGVGADGVPPAEPVVSAVDSPLISEAARAGIEAFVQEDESATNSHLSDPVNENFIPIHGFVWLTDEEMKVVSHPAFQRLGTIYQLGQAHLVYRGATHRRLEHTLGTLHVAQEIVDAIQQNYRRAKRRERKPHLFQTQPAQLAEPLSEFEVTFVRLAALLHDIGHLPEGHTLEDELGFLEKHDEPGRINKVLDLRDWPGGKTESLRRVIDDNFGNWIHSRAISPSELLIQIIAKGAPRELLASAQALLRVNVCRDIVGNTICADLLDYLHRDWYHIGKPKHYDRRIFQYMEIRKDTAGEDQFVISLGSLPTVRTDAVTAILGLLESRYELAESVLFHRTKCAAAAMLERALFELEANAQAAKNENWKPQLERQLLFNGDDSVLDLLLQQAKELRSSAASTLLNALRQRRLYKSISITFYSQLDTRQFEKIQQQYAGSPEAAHARNEAMRTLEKDFKFPAGSLAVYSPDKGMNAKIAKVRIHVDGHIAQFAKFDSEHRKRALSGGHLDAQLDRFQGLWRIQVVIAKEVWDRLLPQVQTALRSAIELCILGRTSYTGQSFEDAAAAIALQLSVIPDGPYMGESLQPREIAARAGEARPAYPNGVPTLRSFFSPGRSE
jgi:uncharacterized protein